MDLLINLYDLQCRHDPQKLKDNGIVIRKALSSDKGKIMEFIKTYFEEGWMYESEHAFSNSPVSCFVAIKNKEIVGFGCYDSTAKGYFGPMGVKPGEKSGGIGSSLMYECLHALKEDGYGYAIIGWVDDAIAFYDKTIKYYKIPDSEPENTMYKSLISLTEVEK